ncbi:hypothetical protein SEA_REDWATTLEHOG_126 [Gordonia phage RedWattleHog]|nr:hypothetical protein SEA_REDWATTLEHOG_126 [Gordonia phage RedWattleHog]
MCDLPEVDVRRGGDVQPEMNGDHWYLVSSRHKPRDLSYEFDLFSNDGVAAAVRDARVTLAALIEVQRQIEEVEVARRDALTRYMSVCLPTTADSLVERLVDSLFEDGLIDVEQCDAMRGKGSNS